MQGKFEGDYHIAEMFLFLPVTYNLLWVIDHLFVQRQLKTICYSVIQIHHQTWKKAIITWTEAN